MLYKSLKSQAMTVKQKRIQSERYLGQKEKL